MRHINLYYYYLAKFISKVFTQCEVSLGIFWNEKRNEIEKHKKPYQKSMDVTNRQYFFAKHQSAWAKWTLTAFDCDLKDAESTQEIVLIFTDAWVHSRRVSGLSSAEVLGWRRKKDVRNVSFLLRAVKKYILKLKKIKDKPPYCHRSHKEHRNATLSCRTTFQVVENWKAQRRHKGLNMFPQKHCKLVKLLWKHQ